MSNELHFLYDDTEETRTRFVSFIGQSSRFDLAITTTNRFYGKKLVTDIQSGRTAIVGSDDLEEEGYIAHAFQLNDEESAELTEFLHQIV